MTDDIVEIVKKPYFKLTIGIAIVVIFLMIITQSLWINIGITTIYKEYDASEVLPNNTVPEGVFILSGNYSYISYWINTTKVSCEENKDIKLLVVSIKTIEGSNFKDVVILDTIEGCNKLN